MGSIAIFSTPNAENSRNLLLRVGFDPWPVWEVTDGRQKLSAAQTRARLNEWLQVRHALAHGGSLPDVSVLDRTRSGATMLTRRCAERCNRFVGSLIISTEQHLHPRSLLDPGEYL